MIPIEHALANIRMAVEAYNADFKTHQLLQASLKEIENKISTDDKEEGKKE